MLKRLVLAESQAFGAMAVGASDSGLFLDTLTRSPGLGPNNTCILEVQKYNFIESHPMGRQWPVSKPSSHFLRPEGLCFLCGQLSRAKVDLALTGCVPRRTPWHRAAL